MPTFGFREPEINELCAFWPRVAEVGLEPGEVPILDDYEPHDHHTGTPPSLDLDVLEDGEREPL